MNRIIKLAALIGVAALALTGCASGLSEEQIACEARGGSWEVQYYLPITTWSGKVPITTYMPVYGCDEAAP